MEEGQVRAMEERWWAGLDARGIQGRWAGTEGRAMEGRRASIIPMQWERWWAWGWKARVVFYHGGYMTRETKCKLSGPLDECSKEQRYQSELKIMTHPYT
jgi:hypothetical protein